MDLPIDVESLRSLLRDHGVRFALVFGSYAADRATERSDVDVAVWASAPVDTWQLQGALPDVVDLVDLRSASDGLVGRIALTGVVIVDDDPPARIRWQAQTRKRHLDEALRRERMLRDFVAAHG